MICRKCLEESWTHTAGFMEPSQYHQNGQEFKEVTLSTLEYLQDSMMNKEIMFITNTISGFSMFSSFKLVSSMFQDFCGKHQKVAS